METHTYDLSNRLYALLAVGLGGLLLFFIVIGLSALEKNDANNQVSVTGDYTLSIVPDVAYVDLGVRTVDLHPEDAVSKNMKDMEKVLTAIRSLGVEDKDIQTQNLTVYPKYEWQNDQYVETGYEAMQNIKVTLTDFTLVASVIADAGKAGANQINNVNFTLKEYDTELAVARQEAILEAKAKAQTIAKLNNTSLDELISYYESTNNYLYDYGKGGGMGSEMSYGEASNYYSSINAGQEEVILTVSLSYRLK